MQLQLEPATSGILSANSSNLVTQVIKLTNNMHGQVTVILVAHENRSFTCMFLESWHQLLLSPKLFINFSILIFFSFAESFGDEVESELQG